jgi:hypothetical protein
MQVLIESLQFWLSFVLISWTLGYASNKFGKSSQCVRVPLWFFYFCGYPKIVTFPRGVLTRQGAFMQIVSFLLLVFALFFDRFFSDRNLSGIVGLGLGLVGAVIFIQILLRYSSYSNK